MGSIQSIINLNYQSNSCLDNAVPLALNLIGPRAMDVLAELSYVSMTPDHFPSMFCKVGVKNNCHGKTDICYVRVAVLVCFV